MTVARRTPSLTPADAFAAWTGPRRATAPDEVALILGERERHDVVSGGVVVALALHGGMLAFAIITALFAQLPTAMKEERAKLHEFFWREYDVEIVKPKDPPKDEPPPPPPEPTPPEPVAAPKAQVKPVDDDPYKNVAPSPSKAAKVLVAEPKNDEPVELPTIVNGDGEALGGRQAGDGKGNRIETSKAASLLGTPGGKGTVTAPPPPPVSAEDKSRAISLVGGAWRCPFPPEANDDQIDHAVVSVQVTVRADGSPSSVSVLSDPGHGFGRAAKNCAMSSRFNPAFDRSGTPIVQSAPVNITFRR